MLLPLVRSSLSPAPLVGALGGAALLALLLPGGRWSDMLALLASTAALLAGHERRERDMLVAAGLAAGLAPAGLLLTPMIVGIAIARGQARRLPLAALVAVLTAALLPWSTPTAALPNLARLAVALPGTFALVAALGVGTVIWSAARATTMPAGALFGEARCTAILLAGLLPLPLGVIGFVLMLAVLPLPDGRRVRAANDNGLARRVVRLAA